MKESFKYEEWERTAYHGATMPGFDPRTVHDVLRDEEVGNKRRKTYKKEKQNGRQGTHLKKGVRHVR